MNIGTTGFNNIVRRVGNVRVFNAVEVDTLGPLTEAQINFSGSSVAVASLVTSDPDIQVSVNTGTIPDRGGYILVSQSDSVAEWEPYVEENNIPVKVGAVAGTYSNPDFILDAEGRLSNMANRYTGWTSWLPLAGNNIIAILNNNSFYRVNGNIMDVQMNFQATINTGGGVDKTFEIDGNNLPLINFGVGGFSVMEEFAISPPTNIINRYAQINVAGNIFIFVPSFPVDASSRTVRIWAQLKVEVI